MQAGGVFDDALVAKVSQLGDKRSDLTAFYAWVDNYQAAGSGKSGSEACRRCVIVDDGSTGNTDFAGLPPGAVFNQLQRRA